MPKYVIERDLPGAGKLSDKEIRDVSAASNKVLHAMASEGKDVQWIQSYVTGDKLYCVYNAPSADAVREHAKRGGFPANAVNQVTRVIDPTNGEAKA
jgi:Protein of unknown function (DUF4242)